MRVATGGVSLPSQRHRGVDRPVPGHDGQWVDVRQQVREQSGKIVQCQLNKESFKPYA